MDVVNPVLAQESGLAVVCGVAICLWIDGRGGRRAFGKNHCASGRPRPDGLMTDKGRFARRRPGNQQTVTESCSQPISTMTQFSRRRLHAHAFSSP